MFDAQSKKKDKVAKPTNLQARPAEPSLIQTGERISFQLFTRPPAAAASSENEADAAASAVLRNESGSEGTGNPSSTATPADDETSNPSLEPSGSNVTAPFGVIVEDGSPLGPGQVYRTQFIETISADIERVADEELAAVGRTAVDCPYLSHWLRFYRDRPAAHTERAIQHYAHPERPEVESLREAVVARVRGAVQAWVRSGGRVIQAPEGIGPLGTDDRVPLSSASGITIQRKAIESLDVNHSVAPTLDSAASVRSQLQNGHTLEGSVRHRMERGFGHSFADVQVHTDSGAGQMAAAHSARAFTVGSDIAFGAGQYRPGTPAGDVLIAHELAHVIQQRGAVASPAPWRMRSDDSTALEADADTGAVRAVIPRSLLASRSLDDYAADHPALQRARDRSADATPELSSGLRLQRCGSEPPLDRELLAVAPTTTQETFAPDNIPGVRPGVEVQRGGVDAFTFDGDGDQMRELGASLRTLSEWPSGAARQIRVDITMLGTSELRSATYELPDSPGGSGPLFVIFDEPTDGRRPARISLVSPMGTQVLLFYPPERTPQLVTYRAELSSQPFPGDQPPTVSQSQTFSFPANTSPLRQVFHAEAPVTIGGIHALDISAGAYNDRFRLTFNKPDPNQSGVILGISVLSEGAPVAGERANITVPGSLSVRVLQTDGIRLALDLNGDGQADLELFDRLTGPTGYDYVSPLQYRTHSILAVGSGLPADQVFYYRIRNGMIVAGSTAPRAEDRAAASNAQAVTGLAQQETMGVEGLTQPAERGTIQGELDIIESMLTRARARALENNLISQSLFDAWDVVARDFIILEPQISALGSPVQSGLQEQTAVHAQAFYDVFAAAAVSADMGGGGRRGFHLRNRYTGMDVYVEERRNPGQILAQQIRAGQWRAAVEGFHLLVHGLDLWIAEKARERFGSPDPNRAETNLANEVQYLTNLRQRLADARSANPVRVSAVFHPAEPYMSSGRVTEVPLSLYYTHEGSDWYLYDYTNPEEPWHTTSEPESTPGETVPPRSLFARLDEGDHFAVGTVHYQLHGNGYGGQVATTGPGTWRQVLTYVGLGAAAIGLGLVTFGSGTVAVVGAYALAVSALAGGTMAAVDLYERFAHGTATIGTVLLDVAQIVAAITGIGALASGRILSVARVAAAESTPLRGPTWALLAGWAQRIVVPLAATNVAADIVTVAVMTEQAANQYDAIDNAPGTPDSRRRAKFLLLSQLAVTGGLAGLSLRGNVAEITRGRSIKILNVGGEPVVVPVGQSTAGAQVTRTRPAGTADDAAFQVAERQHLENITRNVTGEGGQALAEVERLALSNQAGRSSGTLMGDAAGNLTRSGQSAGTLQELTQRVAQANNASRAHGITTEYVLDVRPGSTPGTTEVRIVGRARQTTGAVGPSTASLYVDVPARAQSETTQLQRLLAVDQALPAGDALKGSRFEINPDGMIGINGQLDISPSALAEIRATDLPRLLRATRELDMKGELNQVSPANRTALTGFVLSGSYRLRFGFSRQTARGWLAAKLQALGLDINTVQVNGRSLFANMSTADLDRLYEAMASGRITAAPNLQSRGVAYALGRNPDSVRSFVEHYEFFVADFVERAQVFISQYSAQVQNADAAWAAANPGKVMSQGQRQQIRNSVKDSLGIPRTRTERDFYYEQLEGQMRDPTDVTRPSTAVQEDVFARYEQMRSQLNGRFGVRNIQAGLSNLSAIGEIQDLPDITFSTEAAAVYHVRKHLRGLPPSEQTSAANQVNSYLDAAVQTIRDATPSSVIVRVSQDGTARSFTFTRQAGGVTTRAIVVVTNEGRVMLATYQ